MAFTALTIYAQLRSLLQPFDSSHRFGIHKLPSHSLHYITFLPQKLVLHFIIEINEASKRCIWRLFKEKR